MPNSRIAIPRGVAARFVLLLHTGHGAEHCDLMLDLDGQELLPTWRLTFEAGMEPLEALVAACYAAERIDDHRRHYLTYEGDISNDRGRVRRVAEGSVAILDGAEGVTIVLQVEGPGMPSPALVRTPGMPSPALTGGSDGAVRYKLLLPE